MYKTLFWIKLYHKIKRDINLSYELKKIKVFLHDKSFIHKIVTQSALRFKR